MPGGTPWHRHHGTAIGKGYTDDGKAAPSGGLRHQDLQDDVPHQGQGDADGIMFDPETGACVRLRWRFQPTLTAIDPKTDKVVATVRAGGRPEFAVAGRARHNLCQWRRQERNRAHRYRQPRRSTRIGRFRPARSPHGLAIDTQAAACSSVCDNGMMTVADMRDRQGRHQLAHRRRARTRPLRSRPQAWCSVPTANHGTSHRSRKIAPENSPCWQDPDRGGARTMEAGPATGTAVFVAAAIDRAPVPAQWPPDGPSLPGR